MSRVIFKEDTAVVTPPGEPLACCRQADHDGDTEEENRHGDEGVCGAMGFRTSEGCRPKHKVGDLSTVFLQFGNSTSQAIIRQEIESMNKIINETSTETGWCNRLGEVQNDPTTQ